MRETPEKMGKVYLVGDSITQGLGSRKINFQKELEDRLRGEFEVVNLALTGTTIQYANMLIDDNEIIAADNVSFCVILYGNVDAQIRPNRSGRLFRLIPSRYRKNGMLMPRPFYSRSLLKRLGQLIDNLGRSFFAKMIIWLDGTEQWVDIATFSAEYRKFVNSLTERGLIPILCSTVFIDEKLFHETPNQYELFNAEIQKLSIEKELIYIDFYQLFKRKVSEKGWGAYFNHDHFHPNGAGYGVMAREIARAIKLSKPKLIEL